MRLGEGDSERLARLDCGAGGSVTDEKLRVGVVALSDKKTGCECSCAATSAMCG